MMIMSMMMMIMTIYTNEHICSNVLYSRIDLCVNDDDDYDVDDDYVDDDYEYDDDDDDDDDDDHITARALHYTTLHYMRYITLHYITLHHRRFCMRQIYTQIYTTEEDVRADVFVSINYLHAANLHIDLYD